MARITKAEKLQIEISNLQTEAEAEHAEFLMAEAERILAEEREAAQLAQANAKLCRCGCGGTPVGKTARFIPGHDGRLKGRLLKEARGTDEAVAANAVTQLKAFGWEHFLIERVKDAKKRRAAERRVAKAAEEAGQEAPVPASSLTPEDRARIAAIRANRANGMRDITKRSLEEAPIVA